MFPRVAVCRVKSNSSQLRSTLVLLITAPSYLLLLPSLPLPQFSPVPSIPISEPILDRPVKKKRIAKNPK